MRDGFLSELSDQTRVVIRRSQETTMADDLKNRGAQDRARISLNEDHEVRYWTKELGVSKDQLTRIALKHKGSAAAVREELRR